MNSTLNIYAVVVTHNRLGLLKKALAGLRSQSRVLSKIVVVDNASDVDTRKYLSGEKDLHVVTLKNNLGGAGGFSRGVEESIKLKADWIWLLDDDAIPDKEALNHLLHYCNHGDSKIGALTSSVYENGKIAGCHRRKFNRNTLTEPNIKISEYRHPIVKIETASFVGFLLNAAAVKQIGIPDERFFLAYDDTEYSLRLITNGWKIFLIPHSKISHLRGSGGRLLKPPYGIKHYYNLRNQLIVFRKYGEASQWRLSVPILKGLVLAFISGHGKPESLKLWWRAYQESKTAPYVLKTG